MPNETFKRFVAKTAAQVAVSSAVSHATIATANTIIPTEEDSVSNDAIDLGGSVFGFVVSWKLRPLTDGMVDRVADWHVARKAAKAVIVTP